MFILYWSRSLFILVQRLTNIFAKSFGWKWTILCTSKRVLMSSGSGILFLKTLCIIHKCFSCSKSCSILWSFIFIFQMRLVLPWSREFRYLLSDKIINLLPARETSFLWIILIYKSTLIINSRSWSLLRMMNVGLTIIASEFTSWVGWWCEIGSWSTHIVIWSWCLFCFC